MINDIVSKLIKVARITQPELAERLGISEEDLKLLMEGEYPFTFQLLAKINHLFSKEKDMPQEAFAPIESGNTSNQYEPDYVSPPGEVIKELLEDSNQRCQDLAKCLGISKKKMKEILSGTDVITPRIAKRLGKRFGTASEFWLRREELYREYLSRQDIPPKKLPIIYTELSKWDKRHLEIARQVRDYSKDPGTKVGAVVAHGSRIIATGYNGLPRNYPQDTDFYSSCTRDEKLAITTHAEVNAILNAASNGASTSEATVYVTFPPCSNCVSALVNAGIKRIVAPEPAQAPERWRNNFLYGKTLAEACGLDYTTYIDSSIDLRDAELPNKVTVVSLVRNANGEFVPVEPLDLQQFRNDIVRKSRENLISL